MCAGQPSCSIRRGSTLGAMALGRTIRSLNMSTTVGRTTELPATEGKEPRAQLSPRAECKSMCTFVLLAGVKRSVPHDARVLVHQIWLGDRRNDATAAVYSAEDLVLVERDIGRLAVYTVEMGGGIELLDLALRIPPWEPMRLLTQDELRRMRLSTVDDPFDRAVVVAATNSAPTGTGFERILEPTERGWALVERSGSRALARRHPLTREGEDIGRFDLIFSCANTSNVYNVTYIERRGGHDQHALAPLKDVTLTLGSGNAALKIASSELSSRPVELASVARGTVAAALVRSFARPQTVAHHLHVEQPRHANRNTARQYRGRRQLPAIRCRLRKEQRLEQVRFPGVEATGGLGKLLGPSVDDGVAVDVLDAGQMRSLLAYFEFTLMCRSRAGELGEEALDEVEPGAMLGREGELEAASRACGRPRFSFPRDMSRMIVEDELDGGTGGISDVEKLEEFDELSAAMAIPDKSVDLAGRPDQSPPTD